jgi:hypothetical protein
MRGWWIAEGVGVEGLSLLVEQIKQVTDWDGIENGRGAGWNGERNPQWADEWQIRDGCVQVTHSTRERDGRGLSGTFPSSGMVALSNFLNNLRSGFV